MESLTIFDAAGAAREVQRLTKLFVRLHGDLESSVMEFCQRWGLNPSQPHTWASGLSSTMLNINRDFRYTAVKAIDSRVKLARTRSTVAIIKQTLPSVIVFDRRQMLSVNDIVDALKSNYDNLPPSHRVSLKEQVWEVRQLSESYSKRTAELQSKASCITEWDRLVSTPEESFTAQLYALRDEVYCPRNLGLIVDTLSRMRRARTGMLRDAQYASTETAPQWTADLSQNVWAEGLSRVRSFYCTIQKQVITQRELINDITSVLLEAKCSSRAINYPTGASYELCKILHSLCTLEEVEKETISLDKMHASVTKAIHDVQTRLRDLRLY